MFFWGGGEWLLRPFLHHCLKWFPGKHSWRLVRFKWHQQRILPKSLEWLFCGLRGFLGNSFPVTSLTYIGITYFLPVPPATSQNHFSAFRVHFWRWTHAGSPHRTVSTQHNDVPPPPQAATVSAYVNGTFNSLSKASDFSQSFSIRCSMRSMRLSGSYLMI